MSEKKYIVPVEHIPTEGMSRKLAFAKEECIAAAARLAIPEIKKLEAAFLLHRKGSLIHVSGQLDALLTRECVASLEEMEEVVSSPFALDFTLKPVQHEQTEEGDLAISEDEPEPLPEKKLDLEDVAVQQLSLEMDPYPKKEGAAPLEDPAPVVEISPFAVLKDVSSTE